jgi:broad specificity phosphatase PhoE
MKLIEVRRHSIRDKGSDSLSAEGIALVRKVKNQLFPTYDLYISSPKQRAQETMSAFGFTEYIVDERFSTLNDINLDGFSVDVEKVSDEKSISTFEALFEVREVVRILKKSGEEFLNALKSIASNLPENGKALIISHGGAIEPAALLGFNEYKLSVIGGELEPCEGAIFYFNGSELEKVEIKKLTK